MHKTHSSAFMILSPLVLAFTMSGCSKQGPETPPASAPEQTLETECPQINAVETVTIPSDFPIIDDENDVVFNLTGEVSMIDEAQQDLIFNLTNRGHLEKEYKPRIHINVSSVGGDMTTGLTIAESIGYYGAENVTALCMGDASSAASYFLLATEKTYGYPSCEITTHGTSLDSEEPDKKGNLKSQREQLKEINIRIESGTAQEREYYKEKLGLSDGCAEFLTRKGKDTIIYGKTALKLGFLDAVLADNGMMVVRKGEEARFLTEQKTASPTLANE